MQSSKGSECREPVGFSWWGKGGPHVGYMTLRLQDFTVTRCLEEQIQEQKQRNEPGVCSCWHNVVPQLGVGRGVAGPPALQAECGCVP